MHMFVPRRQPPCVKMRCLYTTLGAAPGCTPDELRKAYRRAALATHPDKHPDDSTATERFREVRRAWLILSDEARRAAYDLRSCQRSSQSRRKSSRSAGCSAHSSHAETPHAAEAAAAKAAKAAAAEVAAKAAAAVAAAKAAKARGAESDSSDAELWEGTWEDLEDLAEEVWHEVPSWDALWAQEVALREEDADDRPWCMPIAALGLGAPLVSTLVYIMAELPLLPLPRSCWAVTLQRRPLRLLKEQVSTVLFGHSVEVCAFCLLLCVLAYALARVQPQFGRTRGEPQSGRPCACRLQRRFH